MATQNVIPISGGSIEIGHIGFDLLTLDTAGQLAVLAPSGSVIKNSQREELLVRSLPVFVRASQFNEYLEYVFDRIERVVTSQYVTPAIKADLMFQLGKRFVAQIHASTIDSALIDRFGRFVKSYIDLMLHSRESASQLLELTSSAIYSLSHSFNTCTFSMLIGQKLFGNNRIKLWELGMGGMLIDIGMARIDPMIRNKKGGLTPGEMDQVRKHTLISGRFLERLNFDRQIIAMGLYHHERFDGSGYPSGLAGEEIPLYARIAAVADVYDAITSDRAYRQRADQIPALAEMFEQRNKFDPQVLDALASIVLKSEKLIKAFKETYLGPADAGNKR